MATVRFKKLDPRAKAPVQAHPTDAGFDLQAVSFTMDECGNFVYGTGLALEIPEGYVGLLFPRSSISKTDMALTNCVGVIDSGYRGEVMFKFKSSVRSLTLWSLIRAQFSKRFLHREPKSLTVFSSGRYYRVGERIGQLLVVRLPVVTMKESDNLDKSDRGEGGFGSTGE